MVQRDSPIRIRLSRLGWQFAFIGMFAMLGGAIRSYNLPLVLAGLLVGALLLQWRWSRQTLVALTVKRRLPTEAFAGQPFTVRFWVTNHSRWFPSWLLRIDDTIMPPGTTSGWMAGWIGRPSGSTSASCGLGAVPPERTLSAQYQCEVQRRGRYAMGPAVVSTGVPLGLMLTSRTFRLHDNLFVFPRRLVLQRHWRRVLNSREGGTSATAGRSGVQEGDFFGLRGWQAGDSRRWIHWRTTARTGELAVRQFEKQRRFDLCILVDAFRAEPQPVSRRSTSAASHNDGLSAEEAALEFVISAAATLVTALVATPTSKIGLTLAGRQIVALPSGGTREQTVAMLRHLSELQGSAAPDLAAAIKQMIQVGGRPRDLLILSPRTAVDQITEMRQLLSNQTGLKWCSVADGSIHQLVERFPAAAVAIESSPAAAVSTAVQSV